MEGLHNLTAEAIQGFGPIDDGAAFALYYLPLRARAEPIRLILQYGGVKYQDVTISMTDWAGVKACGALTPFGQLPSIRLPSGEVIAQSGAIARYAAQLAKIYPADPLAAARADMVYEYAQDLNMINPLLNFWPTETDTWANNYQSFFQALPQHLNKLSLMLGDKHFYGGMAPTHGDFAIFHVLDACFTMRQDSLQDYPTLLAFMHRVASIPSVKAYLDSRSPPEDVGLCGSYMQREIAKVHHHK